MLIAEQIVSKKKFLNSEIRSEIEEASKRYNILQKWINLLGELDDSFNPYRKSAYLTYLEINKINLFL